MTTATAQSTATTKSPKAARADAMIAEILETTALTCQAELNRAEAGDSARRESIAVMREMADNLANQARVISHMLEGVR